ncbi:MAG TPA: translation initiation factor IF-2, partial [Gammaproteobacteria bacterium]|nr:translation initiation factor IF-2 [Gammaproteobacteria bacterium]
MADVTISELAKVVGVDVDKLLSQVKDAGLPHKKADEIISNDDKNTLLQSLRGSHGEGEGAAAPSKITLKRKTLGTLKSASSSGRGKTVNVEVRKKRTYVKRTEVEEEVVPEEPVAVEPAIITPDPVVAAEAAIAAAAEAAKAPADEPAPAAPSAPAARAAAPIVPDVPSEEAASARADKPGAKRKPATKKEIDDEAEKKRTQARTTKGKPAKRQNRTLHVNDAFVLEGGDSEGRRRGGRRGRNRLSGSTQAFEMPTEAVVRDIKIGEANKVTDLAQQMTVKAAAVVKALFKMGVMANINHVVDADTATLLVEEMGHRPNFVSEDALEEQLAESLAAEIGEEKITRAPVVTVMGHVDHGKTSLLDYIRKSTVASHEAGGITQHIGAYHVDTDHGMVSFLDTPGHAAFSAMRSRGAKATDVIVLVVAGDDGVKPQTAEAVQHAKAAGVPLVVAINKMDKEGADPDRVKNELAAMEVIPDDWGGDTQFIPVSAHTGDGVDKLLEAILLQAELMELTAYTDVPGQGVVVESRLDKGRGAVASVLVQNGTLRTGDIVLVGKEYGRVRALVDENGVNIKSAGPSIPVEILGLTGVPDAGDEFVVLADEKKAKEVAEFRRTRLKDSVQAMQQAALIDNMFAGIGKPNLSIFNIILKTDVRGTLEALTASLVAMNTDEVQVKVVSSGVGGISENDVHLAATSKAMIVGFNVRADKTSKEIIDNEGLQLRYYNVIYNVLDDVKAIMGGMLSPEIREEILGVAEVRDVFTSPKFGQIAGSM